MSTEPEPPFHKENIYIIDPENAAEVARLVNLDRLTTKAMGGPLAGLPALPKDAQILDIACGPGGWVLDIAFAHPYIDVAGIDISQTMIKYAGARARSQGLENASFGVMDASEPLDFSDNTFHLVNGRYLFGSLQREKWPQLLGECMRILRPGGILRMCEAELAGKTNSAAYEQLNAWFAQALQRGGYGFSCDGRTFGIMPVLPALLRNAGCEDIQLQAYAIDFSAGTETWADFYHNAAVGFKMLEPFFFRTQVTTQPEFDEVYARAMQEMHMDTFCGVWYFLGVWGIKPV